MENKPVRRRPPRHLPLPLGNDAGPGKDEKGSSPSSQAPRARNRNSALIEKLQANLALSPTALLPSPKSPGVKLMAPAFPPSTPASSPASPVVISPPSEEEPPISFEAPAEAGALLSINKARPRLSVKRRPPSRRHRKSSADEAGAVGGSESAENPSPTGPAEEEEVFEEQLTKGQETDSGSHVDTTSASQVVTTDSEERDSGKATGESTACVEAPQTAGKEEATAQDEVEDMQKSLAEAQKASIGSEPSVDQEPVPESVKEPHNKSEPGKTTEEKEETGEEDEEKPEDKKSTEGSE